MYPILALATAFFVIIGVGGAAVAAHDALEQALRGAARTSRRLHGPLSRPSLPLAPGRRSARAAPAGGRIACRRPPRDARARAARSRAGRLGPWRAMR